VNKESSVIKVIQLSDTHLFSQKTGLLAGMNTQSSLEKVIAHLRTHHLPANLILATGDIAHNDSSSYAYERFVEMISPLHTPTYALPGNHDKTDVMKSALEGSAVQFCGSTQVDQWNFILLNSVVWGSVHGHLSTEELQRLEETLKAWPDHHTLIALHHHPVPLQSRWISPIGLDNQEALYTLIDQYPQVRAIVWGHIHQDFVSVRNSVELIATPSTCIQFKPRQDEFELDYIPPGYRWFELYPDGKIKTGVERIHDIPQDIDFNTHGYE
jgi:Icc protein